MLRLSRRKCGVSALSLSLSLGLASLTVFSGAILSAPFSFADDSVVDDINITVPIACTMSGTGMTSHTATINPGNYTPNIGTTTLKAYCNDSSGFAIYAAGYTGNTIGETNSNKLVGTTHSTETIPTGIATSGTSQWAMKLTTDSNATYPITIDSAPNTSGGSDATFSAYHVVPNEYTKVAHRNSSTDVGTNAIGAELTTTYAVNISSTQIADTYVGQVIYTMVHPATHAAPVYLNPNVNDISDVDYMQQFAVVSDANRQAIIASMTTGQQYTLTDTRDNKTYTIAKLADGNVWMTQNLDLDLDAETTYTNEDTDIGYNTSTGTYGTAAWSPTRSTYSATNTQTHQWCQGGTWNSQYGYCESNDTPESYDPGSLYWNLATDDNWTDWGAYYSTCDFSTSTPVCDQSENPISTYTSSTGTAQYHLGNYYNWAAALATNDSSVYSNTDLVEQSICPAGWTLPRIGDGEDSFQALWEEYGYDENNGFTNISTLWSSPLYLAASGRFDGALYDVGDGGYFWSPVAYGSLFAGHAGFLVGGDAFPSGSSDRGRGFSIRCVARPVASSASGSGGGGVPK